MNWIGFEIKKAAAKKGILQRPVSLEEKISVFYLRFCLWQEEQSWILKLWQLLF